MRALIARCRTPSAGRSRKGRPFSFSPRQARRRSAAHRRTRRRRSDRRKTRSIARALGSRSDKADEARVHPDLFAIGALPGQPSLRRVISRRLPFFSPAHPPGRQARRPGPPTGRSTRLVVTGKGELAGMRRLVSQVIRAFALKWLRFLHCAWTRHGVAGSRRRGASLRVDPASQSTSASARKRYDRPRGRVCSSRRDLAALCSDNPLAHPFADSPEPSDHRGTPLREGGVRRTCWRRRWDEAGGVAAGELFRVPV